MSVSVALIVYCVCLWHRVNGGGSPFVNLVSNVRCCVRYLHNAAPARRACSPAIPGDFFLDWYPIQRYPAFFGLPLVGRCI